jgi:hypothetical protein
MSEERNANLLGPVAQGRSYTPGWSYTLAIGLLAMLLVALGAAYPLAAGAIDGETAAANPYAADWQRFQANENPEALALSNYGAAWERFLAENVELMRADAYAAAWERALAGEYDLQLAAAERYAAAWEQALARDYDLQLAAAGRYAAAWEGFIATWDGCETLVC